MTVTSDGVTPEPGAVFRAGAIFYLVLAIAGVLWVGWSRGTIPLGLFVDLERWWLDALLGAAAGLALVAAWSLGRRFSPAIGRLETEIRRALGPLPGDEAIALALLSGFAEELFFRGAMQSSWGWGWALAVFALVHTMPGAPSVTWMVYAALAGGIFAWLTLVRENISAAVVAHVLVNTIQLRRLGRLDEPPDEELG